MLRLLSTVLCALMLVMPTFAQAGSSAAGKSILPIAEVATFSNAVQQDLAARGAKVAIVARTGRDPATLPAGVRYTHVSYWVYSRITHADGSTGVGYRVYNLYQTDGDLTRSALVQDSPADFFAGAQRLDAGIIIPDPRLQAKILGVINSSTYANLHNPRYSVLANPDTTQFQNCTEHTLDVLFASIYGTSDRAQIKANIAAYFQPQDIQIDGLKRLFAPVASQALTTADHGATIGTATFGSIARFMQANQLASEVYRMTPGQVSRF